MTFTVANPLSREARDRRNATVWRRQAEGLWGRIDRSGGDNACWLWTGSRQTKDRYGLGGYGFFRVRGRVIYVHRWALEQALGRQLAEGMFACHTCDNPPCCNPRHLFEGTQGTNLLDAGAKGRTYNKQLTTQQVLSIRQRVAAGEKQKRIAADFGVTTGCIQAVASRRTWAWLGDNGQRLCLTGGCSREPRPEFGFCDACTARLTAYAFGGPRAMARVERLFIEPTR